MTYAIWCLWVFSVLANCIVLLNFLIAIISTSYDEVMTGANSIIYEGRSDVNYESTLLVNFYDELFHEVQVTKVFTLLSNTDAEEADPNTTGIVRPIKKLIHDFKKKFKEEITELQTVVDDQKKILEKGSDISAGTAIKDLVEVLK